MIEVTKEAIGKLEEHFEGQDRQPIRVYVAQGGCAGPMLGLALDSAKDGDKSFDIDGFTFIAEEGLFEYTGDINIHANEHGFQVASEKQLPGGGGCGSGGCCGSSEGGCGSGCS
ncbi:IscA/HesB family protein [Salidesulfovibrio onnuriiensis]|uniref:IscA/HesB family protein n=1 Tax=Salidesulfovibrio onnuriiensis TaxID=2583823 RepID=UPI0011CC089C|nr:IscA/HesB family protein [Salidesulfovibrio onnuriiensis]